MAKKTFNVNEFRVLVNNTLATTGEGEMQYRHGIIDALEHVLHETGNYKGFRYLSKDEVPWGIPGINGPIEDLSYEERFANTDSTRREYK